MTINYDGDDTFSELLDLQEALQVQSYGGVYPRDLDQNEKIEFIRWNVLALEDELHEALAEVGWKPWAKSRHINEDAFRGELIDALHFLMNLMLVVGMNGNEVASAYKSKRRKNAKRQTEGYDGITGKCPGCRRALDDSAVACVEGYCHAQGRPV